MNEQTSHKAPVVTQERYSAGVAAMVKALRVFFFSLVLIIIGMLVYFAGFASAFQVQPQEEVIVKRFGRLIGVYSTGWQWFLPYPVTSYVKVPVSERTLVVDFKSELSRAPAGMVPPQAMMNPLDPERDQYLITADSNIVHTSWSLTYRIVDARKYYTELATPPDPMGRDQLVFDHKGRPSGIRGPEALLSSLLKNAAVQVTANVPVLDVIYGVQAGYVDQVQRRMAESLEQLDIGVTLTGLQLMESNVPAAVRPAFDMAQAAGTAKETQMRQAEQYAAEVRGSAVADAREVVSKARIHREQQVKMIEAEVKYFEQILKAYDENAEATLIALYYDAVQEMLGNARDRYILGSANSDKLVRLRLNPEPDAESAESNASEVRP